MTIDGAINWLQRGLFAPQGTMTTEELSCIAEAYGMALTALRIQQEAEKNEPLTLDDLREMDGQPAWAEEPDGYKHYSRWCLVDCAWKSKGLIYLRSSPGQITIEAFIANGGKIYCHPPKEVEK